jgi:predicted AAA+ superfamily ATPase
MSRIREALVELNPWWKGEFTLEYKEREIYDELEKFVPVPQIIALTGLRRVGKTTLMLKMVEDAIRKGFNPRDILYFTFDEFRESQIREVLSQYETLMERDPSSGRYLVLFDEIQKVKDWQDQLKALYDRYQKHLKIVISGSESLFIRKGAKETLAGRLFEFKIEPLSFREYLAFKGTKYKPIGLYEKDLARLFDEFIISEGFPELVGVKDKAVVRKYLRESIVEKVVFRDLPGLLGIRDVSTLESLLNILMEEPGQLIEISQLAGELKVSRQTLSNYLTYLEQSFLVRKLYNYSTGRRKVERKLKKYYPTVVSVDLLFRDGELSRSKVLEWVTTVQLRAEFFWRDPYKNEVDLILTNRKPVPVEVKHGKIDLAGLQAFMRKFKVEKGYVVSLDREETRKVDGRSISIVPAYKFLLTGEANIGS